MKPHILIIEDDPDIAESIRYNIEREAITPRKSRSRAKRGGMFCWGESHGTWSLRW
jgi:DNA-binding response OmpR family regulator